MIDFILYDTATGEITSGKSVLNADEIAANTPPGRGAIEGQFSPDTHYVDISTMKVAPRPQTPSMETKSYDLAQLPEQGRIIVADENGFETEILAQSDMLELTEPGVYRVKSISPFPYTDFTSEVTVT